MAIDITKLEEGLEGLRGLDYLACASRVRKKGTTDILLKTNEEFQTELIAAALKCPVADVRELSLKEYSRALQITFNFLFSNVDATETNEI